MASVVVVGGQWGDEGKGKIVDLLTEHAEICARFSGGHNAGHTVKIGDTRYPLHLVPCGILRPHVTCVLGNGVVVEPGTLLKEIDQLAKQGIEVPGRLLVSDRAHLVLPHHPLLDGARESQSARALGTTRRGIGPCYADKAARIGLRVADLSDPAGPERLEAATHQANEIAVKLWGAPPLEVARVLEDYFGAGGYRDRLEPYVANTVEYLGRRMDEGASVLMEGAQGALLDLDHGTYPYVTSSNCTAGGACTGLGVPPRRIDAVLGVFKAYSTRVGEGTFPTELLDSTGETIRKRGNEYGTTTGRPRRCGWFDVVAARHAIRINGIESIALTLLDVLDEFDEVKVCTAYEHRGHVIKEFPSQVRVLAECKPVFRTMPGWKTSLCDLDALARFPQRALDYLAMLEDLLQVEVAIVSTGPERRRTIVRDDTRFWKTVRSKRGE